MGTSADEQSQLTYWLNKPYPGHNICTLAAMTAKILYTPREMHTLVTGNRATIIDIRSPDSYRRGHIPGAVNIYEIFSYLLANSTPQALAEMAAFFSKRFQAAGVKKEQPVIFYEDNLASQYGGACRGYWLLSYLGHPAAGVLAEGFDGWLAAGFATETLPPRPAPGSDFKATPVPTMLATLEEVRAAIDSPEVILLDNRDQSEWRGSSSSPYGVDFAPRRGKIPGAKWIEWYAFMTLAPRPAFRPVEEIRALCADHQLSLADDIIIYCFKGARAAHTYVAMKRAGFQRLRVYLGSWNEWSRHPELPIS